MQTSSKGGASMKGKIRFFQVFLVVLFLVIGKVTFADIKVYDANDQYLGILVDHLDDRIILFIPSMGKFMGMTEGHCDNIGQFGLLYEAHNCTGIPYSMGLSTDHIKKNCGKYYTRDNQVKEINVVSFLRSNCYCGDIDSYQSIGPWGTRLVVPAIEILESEIPFSLPAALPLRYELSKNGDFDGDGDVDGADLAEFAKIYGK